MFAVLYKLKVILLDVCFELKEKGIITRFNRSQEGKKVCVNLWFSEKFGEGNGFPAKCVMSLKKNARSKKSSCRHSTFVEIKNRTPMIVHK